MGVLGLLCALILGLIGGAAVAIVLARRPARGTWVSACGGVVLGCLGGAMFGFCAGTLVEVGILFSKASQGEKYRALPLRLAACGGNTQQVSERLRGPLNSKERRYAATIALECSFHEPSREDIFALLMPLVHEVYIRGEAPKPTPSQPQDYCYILDLLIDRFDVQRLRRLKSLGLPLNCEGGNSYLQIRPIAGPRGRLEFGSNKDRYRELFAVLGNDLRSYRSMDDETLLDLVVAEHDAYFIETALNLGIDPTHAPGRNVRLRMKAPATVRWTLRKYFNSHEAPLWPQPLTAEEIARIDALMPPPSLAEINRPSFSGHHTLLHQIYIFDKRPDGGAAFFRYLKDQGADLGLASDRGKTGFLGLNYRLHPDLLAELQQLTDSEVKRMAHPQIAGTSEPGEALWETASKMRNRELQQFLCARLQEGCSSAQ